MKRVHTGIPGTLDIGLYFGGGIVFKQQTERYRDLCRLSDLTDEARGLDGGATRIEKGILESVVTVAENFAEHPEDTAVFDQRGSGHRGKAAAVNFAVRVQGQTVHQDVVPGNLSLIHI